MTTRDSILFHEEQGFRKAFIFVLLFVAMLLPIGILISGLMKEKVSETELVLSLSAVIGTEIPIFVFFYLTKFETIVTAEGFGYRWWPLQRRYRMMLKNELVEIKTRKGPPLTYGLHWVLGYGWVNNVRGRMGFQIRLKSGKKLFIGSQQLMECKAALEKLLNNRIGDFRNEF